MKFLHIDPTNKSQLPTLITAIKSGKPVFILFFMEGCGHCVAMRPEWAKLKTVGSGLGDVTIAAIDSSLLDELHADNNPTVKKLATIVNGFPTIKFIRGSEIIDYNDERTVDRFMAFVKKNMGARKITGGSRRRRYRRHRRSTSRRCGRSRSVRRR